MSSLESDLGFQMLVLTRVVAWCSKPKVEILTPQSTQLLSCPRKGWSVGERDMREVSKFKKTLKILPPWLNFVTIHVFESDWPSLSRESSKNAAFQFPMLSSNLDAPLLFQELNSTPEPVRQQAPRHGCREASVSSKTCYPIVQTEVSLLPKGVIRWRQWTIQYLFSSSVLNNFPKFNPHCFHITSGRTGTQFSECQNAQ